VSNITPSSTLAVWAIPSQLGKCVYEVCKTARGFVVVRVIGDSRKRISYLVTTYEKAIADARQLVEADKDRA